ncbi:MAG TPA: AGE family epimerase/isomerase [Gemmatimonadales bacterium]
MMRFAPPRWPGRRKDPGAPAPASAALHAHLLGTAPLLERILLENLIPFWHPRVLDRRHGGYHLNHGPDGRSLGPAPKSLVANARCLWFFSRMARGGYRADEMLAAARHGHDFLVSSFLDDRHGGFFWQVAEDGSRPLDLTKHQYGQAFAIYALAEYALVSGSPAAAAIAEETAEVVESRLRDADGGGYWDRLEGDWKPGRIEPARTRSAAGGKYLNPMLHLLEAYITLAEARPGSVAAARLPELLLICGSSVVRKQAGSATDAHRADWSPVLDADGARISYGHDLELIHLLIRGAEACGIPPLVLADLFRSLLANARRFGEDTKSGGFHSSGPIGRRADRREKIWWVQAEAMLGALEMYRITGEEAPADAFLATLRWIESYQVDWVHGEWHAFVSSRGRANGRKADAWKGPYHTGRAVIQSLEVLKLLRGGGPSSA